MRKQLTITLACLGLMASSAIASEPLKAGEAYVTRFSGVTHVKNKDKAIIDVNGEVGSIFDLRSPMQKPLGQHWIDEPQRDHITARDAGQIFGIAIDNRSPANIYVAATAKFGLHRNAKNTRWMRGQWGRNGGPGTIYVLRNSRNYQPKVFANVKLNGRTNTGAALGNLAYDKVHSQLFVSDLETGMIFRFNTNNAKNMGYYNHGIDGRSRFLNKRTGKYSSLPTVAFNPRSKANIKNCARPFAQTPKCWNLAVPVRRVYGLGVYRIGNGQTRLYYSAPLRNKDMQSAIWSVGILRSGGFNKKDVRLEFALPKNNGNTPSMVSDIAFSDDNEMLVAETGPFLNIGLEHDEPFTVPHNARLFIYKLGKRNKWQRKGHYNIGGINQSRNSSKFKSTSSAGGTDFAYGYDESNNIDHSKPNDFIWGSGDALCSPLSPCFEIATGMFSDHDEVHGVQGMHKSSYVRSGGIPGFMINSYMVDTDVNMLHDGSKSPAEATRNDATKIGDIEVLKIKPLDATPEEVVVIPHHTRNYSHRRWGSHYRHYSHYRYGSHNSRQSHGKYGSHYRTDSHYRLWSHDRKYSHRKYGSHSKNQSHSKKGSHSKTKSHAKKGSHSRTMSHAKQGSHSKTKSHAKKGSHSRTASHAKHGSHSRTASHAKQGSHSRTASHAKQGSHSRTASHAKQGSHSRTASHAKQGSHSKTQTHAKQGSHSRTASHAKQGSHSKTQTHAKQGSHSRTASHAKQGSHSKTQTHAKQGSHTRQRSHQRAPSHDKYQSHAKYGSHSKTESHAKQGSHSKTATHAKQGSHSRQKSQINVHSRSTSNVIKPTHSRQQSKIRSTVKKKSVSRTKPRYKQPTTSYTKGSKTNNNASKKKRKSYYRYE